MKKLMAVLLSAAMLLVCAPISLAGSVLILSLEVAPQTTAGESVLVSLYLENAKDFVAGNIELSFNADVYRFNTATRGELSVDLFQMGSPEGENVLSCSFASIENIQNSEKILLGTYSLDAIAAGESDFRVTECFIGKGDYDDIPVAVEPQLSIGQSIVVDAEGDEIIIADHPQVEVAGDIIYLFDAMSFSAFSALLKPKDAVVKDRKGNHAEGDALIGTGATVSLARDGEVVDSYTLIYCGDVDGDARISAFDARTVLRVSAKLENASQLRMMVCDADRDGKITAFDARLILRVSARLATFKK